MAYEEKRSYDVESGEKPGAETIVSRGSDEGAEAVPPENDLHRGLKARQITMIALGGAIGTGLVIGSGSGLARAGPVGLLIGEGSLMTISEGGNELIPFRTGYGIMGAVCFATMVSLGEMATYLPHKKGFSGYASRFVDEALGCAVGYNYLFKYLIVTPNNIVAASIVVTYWTVAVPTAAWISIFIVLIVCINMLGIKVFGEVEFWMSLFKVITLSGLILLGIIIDLGGAPNHDRIGFRYWKSPGPFSHYLFQNDTGVFLGVWSSMVNGLFAYMGSELVGVTFGEAKNPRKTVPATIKRTFIRLLVFYMGSIFVVGLIVPSNDPQLLLANKAATSAAASPFVVAIKRANINALPGIINAAILLFVLSAANSDLYIGSRTLYALAAENKAPKIFMWTNKMGVPYVALTLCSAFSCLSFLSVSSGSKTIFGYFVSMVTVFGALTWMSILFSHIRFMRALKAQGISRDTLPYKAPFQPYAAYTAISITAVVTFFKGFDAFIPRFQYKSFITNYIGIPAFVVIFLGWKFWHKTKLIPLTEVDLVTGKKEFDDDEEVEEEKDAARNVPFWKKFWDGMRMSSPAPSNGSNLLSLPFKQTQPIPTFASSITQHILASDSSIHPDTITPDAEGLAAQRTKLFGAGDALRAGDETLKALVAYGALVAGVPTPFPWFPTFAVTHSLLGAFPTSTPITHQNLQYERLSVLYNIAAVHAALGAAARRTDQDGIKACLNSFQKAAGTLATLITALQSLDLATPFSPDLTAHSLQAFQNLCLAQAQEAFWQKAVMDRLKNGTIAKLAGKVAEYYETSYQEAVEAKAEAAATWPGFSFPAVKALHFKAVAQFRKSIDDLGANRYGDEIGRLEVAKEYVDKALESKKGVADAVVRDLKGLQTTLSDNLVRAEKYDYLRFSSTSIPLTRVSRLRDNRLIYLESPTSVSALPPIVPAAMVKPTPPPEVATPLAFLQPGAGGLGKPYFDALVPKEVAMARKVWEDRKTEFVKELAERKDALDAKANKSLASIGLPGAIQALLQPVGLPPSLLAKAAEVKASGGVDRLKVMMKDIRRVAKVNQELLNEAIEALVHEDETDTQHRQKFGTDRWTRLSSSEASAALTSRAESLSGIMHQAGESDNVVRGKFGEWEERIALLDSDEAMIDAAIPSHTAPSLTSTVSQPVKTLRSLLQDLDDLIAARSRIVVDAKSAIQNDDLRKDIDERKEQLRDGEGVEMFEDVFDAGLDKYKGWKRRMDESEGQQEDLWDRIQLANTAFIQSRRDDSILKDREEALQGLDTAFQKHQEITTNLQEGLKFYGDISKLLVDLRDSCKEWAYARDIEARDLVQSLTGAFGGMRLNARQPGVYNPATDGGISDLWPTGADECPPPRPASPNPPAYAPLWPRSGIGASYGTSKSGVGIAAMGVLRPDLMMKCIVPVVMAGIIAIYGLVVSVLISGDLKSPMALYTGFIQLGAGLSVGLAGLSAGFAIGIVGDAGVRGVAQQSRVFVGMILILIFAES
ncbi:hypothetical protein MNV49_007591 [Pseudohyphozyma bogoriensis]|nr:hypothetical protein MNV49_007591 [Pseudohyphozyma bogoriensis]